MSEIIYEEKAKFTQEAIMLECLKNITICLFNEKAELVRKLLESKNHNG